jgi:predicted Zn-dependent protease
MQLTQSYEELAVALAHEIGDLVADDAETDAGATDGISGGGPAGTRVAAERGEAGRDARDSFSHNHEKVADYLGLYFAARAGFEIADADRFWRKIADQDPEAFGFGRVHPASAERFVIIAETKKEIARKRANGDPVEPNWEQER